MTVLLAFSFLKKAALAGGSIAGLCLLSLQIIEELWKFQLGKW